MTLKTLLVAVTREGTWRRAFELPIEPFPGLGIRLDVYELVNVVDVIVGDPTFDVTCIVGAEKGAHLTASWLEQHGFESGPYP